MIYHNIIDVEESWIDQKKLFGLTSYGEGYVKGRFGLYVEVDVYDKEYWPISYHIIKSENRKDILKSLISEAKSRSDISEDTGLVKSTVSKIISDLLNKGLIVCFNPEARANKIYGLTEYGALICSYVFHIKEDLVYFLNDLYLEEHYFDKDSIISINNVKFKIPKGAFTYFCFEDWKMESYMREERKVESFHFEFNSNKIWISVSFKDDADYWIYDNPFERTINNIFGIQSKSKSGHVFSYKSDGKVVSIFTDDDSILPIILIEK